MVLVDASGIWNETALEVRVVVRAGIGWREGVGVRAGMRGKV
jgi:hypothetical protein